MDNTSIDSENIDSLDILRPRVKRLYENISEKPINNRSKTKNIQRTAASSTSLVLKKTSQRELLEKYSVLSYTSLLRANGNQSNEISATTRDKPLIKVTVIPKSPQTQKNKQKRRKTTNKIQATVSNQESSIQAKNLYLVVAGRKKEKIYEIKTIGSAKFSAEKIKHQIHHEEDSIKERSSIKEIIKSLNMDKKKKKGKTRKENTKNFSVNEDPESIGVHNDCRCINSTQDGRYIDARRSRIRIFGQVGLTEDERYVLKCDAMVDGEPITTKFVSDQPRTPDYTVNNIIESTQYQTDYDTMACFDGYCRSDNYRRLRDSNIQVDLNLGSNQNPNSSILRSVENQGTQVNFNVCPTNNTVTSSKRHQTIQCNYAKPSKTMNITENDTQHNVVMETQSPLVIISVYPKQETNEVKVMKSIANANIRPISPSNPTKINKDINLDRNSRNYKDLNSRSDRSPSNRSPSPNRKNMGLQQNRKDIAQSDGKFLRTRTNSPNRLQAFPKRGSTIQNNERINSKPKSTDDSGMFISNNIQKINHILMSGGKKTNTEIKKALVDDYTNRLTEMNMKYVDKPPKYETSKVKINIDSENEYYDVHFEQGQTTTGLHIRKTLKEAASQKHEYNERSASPENSYMLPEKEQRRKSFSPNRTVRKNNKPKDIGIRNSKLKVRDSLEINHKREVVPSKKGIQTYTSDKPNECCRDTNFLAPIKHFKGDSCELPDPVERDKQIRRLLGVNRGKVIDGSTKQSGAYGGFVADHGLFDCFYKKDREKKSESEMTPHQLCSCKPTVLNITKRSEARTNIDQSGSALERTSLYQQLILNRNIQVFLQVEQFTKQKPIILSRKQYDKVKRTIQRTISKKISQEKKKKTCKCSLISVGEIRKRTKNKLPIKHETNKQTQTNIINRRFKDYVDVDENNDYDIQNAKNLNNNASKYKSDKSQIKTIVLFDSKEARNKKDKVNKTISPRQTSSSLEIHYATVGYMKQVTYSSTNIGTLSSSSILRRNNSLFTIFKGRKRSVTPNLGTSDFSIPPLEGNSRSVKGFINPVDSKPKKPFLRRLMSCLVMRSRTSEVKLPIQPHPVSTTVNSSIDSYHFSTSLGAIHMGSSLYDTTASFYTNHSILPIVNSKRGFFNSVREFLTIKRS